MTPGAALLKARQFFRHGLRGAYGREALRPRIRSAQPVTGLTDHRCEVHVMTSRQDWLDLCWGLMSFYRASQRRYALCIHDDGTLPPEANLTLRQLFPDARLIDRATADAQVLPTLAAHPRCLAFRQSNHLSPKVFDFAHYLQRDRMLLLDSDVLFFHEPVELLRRIEDPAYLLNSVNGDIASAYTVDPAQVFELTGVRLVERFNSGLGLIHRGSMRLDWLEAFLELPGIIGNFWRIEQTLYALCSSRFGCELLPSDYDVYPGETDFRKPSRHYVGSVRRWLYAQGMPHVARHGVLR